MNVLLSMLCANAVVAYLMSRLLGLAWVEVRAMGGFFSRLIAWSVAALAGTVFTWCLAVAVFALAFWWGSESAGSWIDALFFGWWTLIIPLVGMIVAAVQAAINSVWRKKITTGNGGSFFVDGLDRAVGRYMQDFVLWPHTTHSAICVIERVRREVKGMEWYWGAFLVSTLRVAHLPIIGFLLARKIILNVAQGSARHYRATASSWSPRSRTGGGESGGGRPKEAVSVETAEPTPPVPRVEPPRPPPVPESIVPPVRPPPGVTEPHDAPEPTVKPGPSKPPETFSRAEEDFFKGGEGGPNGPNPSP